MTHSQPASGSLSRLPAFTDDKKKEVERRLSVYALSAAAAGIGLGIAHPANAEIVYTPTNVVIGYSGFPFYDLDVNGDGTTDFFLRTHFRESIDSSGGTQRLLAKPAKGNGVVGYARMATPLTSGVQIQSQLRFGGIVMASDFGFAGSTFARGKWVNVTNRYLGLKFTIDGETHYGWARVTVQVIKDNGLSATLTGYAYETVANMPIVAGQTSGTETGVNPAPSDGSLGALAAGAMPKRRTSDH
jgi:hypothetical protein